MTLCLPPNTAIALDLEGNLMLSGVPLRALFPEPMAQSQEVEEGKTRICLFFQLLCSFQAISTLEVVQEILWTLSSGPTRSTTME